MKSFLFSFFLFVFPVLLSAQNLVPNPSFEEILSCPDFPGQVWRAQGWYVAENTPDYYNACCNNTFPVVGVPSNIFAYRNAATGDAYCGLWLFTSFPPPYPREKIGVKLIKPLSLGVRYFVSFNLSSVSSHSQDSNGGISKIGMLFSTKKYDLTNSPPTNNYSQFSADSIIADTTGWVLVKGSFVADSEYMYLTIGSFFDNTHTDTIKYWSLNGSGVYSYYYIDDICVTTDSVGCRFYDAITNPIINFPFQIYPNPANDLITVKLNSINANSISLFNSLGQIVYENKAVKNNSVDEIDVSRYRCGIYLLQINMKEEIITQKISIVH